jgi:hypothetical protein
VVLSGLKGFVAPLGAAVLAEDLILFATHVALALAIFFCRSAQRAKMADNMVTGPHVRQATKADFYFAKDCFLGPIGTRNA